MRAMKGLSSLPWDSLVLLEVVFPRWGLSLGLLSSRDIGWAVVELGQKDCSLLEEWSLNAKGREGSLFRETPSRKGFVVAAVPPEVLSL